VVIGADGPGVLVRARLSRPPAREKAPLPDFAQHTPVVDILVQPDFYYRRDTVPGVCVFIDGPHHAGISIQAEDRRAREALENRGHRIVAIRADRPLAERSLITLIYFTRYRLLKRVVSYLTEAR
jgi:hypothetical protein